jgi:AraC-like DNA-binding protein
MMKSLHLVRASGLLPWVKFLDNLGSPVDSLLDSLKLNRELILDPRAYCTEYQNFSFKEQAARLEGIQNLGCLIGLNSLVEDHGRTAQIVMQEATLQDAFKAVFLLADLHNTHLRDRFFFTLSPPEAWLGFKKFYRVKVPGAKHAEAELLFFLVRLMRGYLGQQWKPSKIYIPDLPRPDCWQSDLGFDRVKWHFESDYYAIVFPSHLLSTPRPDFSFKLPQSEVNSWLASQPPQSFSEKVRLLMPSLIQQHILNIEDVAEVMGISKRTLQRHLGNAGLNYREILEQARYAIAREKLANPDLSVTELSIDLGYSSSEHFSRAFKRWSGMSPRRFRLSLGN